MSSRKPINAFPLHSSAVALIKALAKRVHAFDLKLAGNHLPSEVATWLQANSDALLAVGLRLRWWSSPLRGTFCLGSSRPATLRRRYRLALIPVHRIPPVHWRYGAVDSSTMVEYTYDNSGDSLTEAPLGYFNKRARSHKPPATTARIIATSMAI